MSSFLGLSCWPCQLWVAPSSDKSSQCFWLHVGNRAGQQAALSPRIQRLPLSQKERPLSCPGVPDSASRPEPAPVGMTRFSLLQNTSNISNTPGAEGVEAGCVGTEQTDPAPLKLENEGKTQPPPLLSQRVLKQKWKNSIWVIYICDIYIYKSEKSLVSYFMINNKKK